jgi:hypothetical protein
MHMNLTNITLFIIIIIFIIIIVVVVLKQHHCFDFQVLGGNSFVRGGKGERIERISREVRVFVVGGGSYEIMNDLAMRQARL